MSRKQASAFERALRAESDSKAFLDQVPKHLRPLSFLPPREKRENSPYTFRAALRFQARALEDGFRSRRAFAPDFLLPSREAAVRYPEKKTIQLIVRAALLSILWIHAAFAGSTGLMIALFRFIDPACTTLMAWRSASDGWKLAPRRGVGLSSVPPVVRRMLVSVEDYTFYEHRGFDANAIVFALRSNARLGRPLYGGSTLSMQTARTMFLVPDKSYIRKYLELIITIEMELILDKDRILELYFNYAEWGRGVFGIQAACRKYYGRDIGELGVDEAIRIITLLSSPIIYTPDTIGRKAILRDRYAFLSDKYNAPPPTAPSDTP